MQRMSLNRHWTVFTSDREDGETHDIPFFYPHDGAFSMETTFPLPAGKRFFLVYEGLLGQVKVVLNEVPQGEIEGTMTRGQFELKGPFKEENTIRLNFKQTRDTLSPGVCRYLYIESSGDIHIKKLFARGDDSGTLKISYEADGPYEEKDVSFSLSRRGRPVAEFQTMTTTFEGIALYSTKAPELYDLKMRIKDEEKEVRVGFSSTFFSEQGRFIHAGRAKRLSALTYDSMFPGLGSAMPFTPFYQAVMTLRRRLGSDLVILKDFPPSRDFLKAAEEQGLLCLYDLGSLPSLDLFYFDYFTHAAVIGVLLPLTATEETLKEIRLKALGAIVLSENLSLKDADCLVFPYSSTLTPKGLKAMKRARKDDKPFVLMEDRKDKEKDGTDTLAIMEKSKELSASGEIIGTAFGPRPSLADENRFLRLDGFAYASNRLYSSLLRIDDRFFLKEGGHLLAYSNDDYLEVYKDGALLDVFTPDHKAYPRLSHPPIFIRDFVKASYAYQGMKPRDKKKLEHLFNRLALIYPKKLTKLEMLPYMPLLRRYRIDEERLAALFEEAADPRRLSTYQFIASRNGAPTITKTFAPGKERQIYVDLYRDCLSDMRTYDCTYVGVRLVDEYGTLVRDDVPLEISIEGPMKIRGITPPMLVRGRASFYLAARDVDSPTIGILKLTAGSDYHEEIIRLY